MKRKLIVGIILIALIFIVNFNVCTVEAFSEELDPENYITLPSLIKITNGLGTGTIELSSSANDYDIAYQKVDITEQQRNNITNKMNDLKDYISSSKTTLQEKETNVKKLQDEYQTLVNSGTATNEQLTVAQTAYNEAYEDYRKFYDTISTEITKQQNELYSLIPDYTNSWTTTTNTTNNVQLDFKNYSGTANFILWVKITNGTNTYYDLDVYSSIIEQEETITINKSSETIKVDETLQLTATSSKNSTITWTSSDPSIATVSSTGLVKGIKEGNVVITAKGSSKSATCNITVKAKEETDEDNSDDWTDFSNAKFELKKDGISGVMVQISNVVPKADRIYYLLITSDNNKPNVTSEDYDEMIDLFYDNDSKTLRTNDSNEVARYVELNQDIYISILEHKSYNDEKIVLYGKKVERYEEPKYSDAFHATFLASDENQIVTTFTHAKENNRKIQIKVGKITDKSILQKLKNQDSSGFAELLSFAKIGKGIFDKTVEADKDDNAIAYSTAQTGNSLINLTGLEDEAYYFLYIKTDDENGKYISQEAVTLAQADVIQDKWWLFFYGSSDFKWVNVENDDTTAKGNLPQTGVNSIICFTLGIAIICVGTFSYVQYRKNNF